MRRKFGASWGQHVALGHLKGENNPRGRQGTSKEGGVGVFPRMTVAVLNQKLLFSPPLWGTILVNFVFFSTGFFTITDFGDDGSAAGGRVKSAVFFLGLFGFFCSQFGHFLCFF